jgi:N6-L-threonylcarbamoyladenine synthase
MILAFESSCDESALALFDPGRGLVGEWVSSQVDLHGRYGGVVPELATREHLTSLPLLLREAAAHPDWRGVTSVAVTTGPGLAGCLALGIAAAKAVALARNLQLTGVNHLRAHAWSGFIPEHMAAPLDFSARLEKLLPHVGLLVSGGNTALFVIHADHRLELLGGTIDDAAGEALDKGAKLLSLGYPGGPLVERLAIAGNPAAFDFPRALPNRGDLDFSFSGLKTSLRYRVAGMPVEEQQARRADLCASYQAAVVDVLVRKTGFALERFPARSVGLSGGVANNLGLRERLATVARERGIPFLPAAPEHTGDNAGMIAFAAWIDPAPRAEERHGWRIEPSLALDVQPSVNPAINLTS